VSGESRDSGEAGNGDAPFSETLSPVFALLNTRSARGFYAESYLVGQTEESVRFQLRSEPTEQRRRRRGKEPEKATFPLGWTLSSETELRMVRQAAVSSKTVEVCELLAATSDDPRRCGRPGGMYYPLP
jgi:hypothetical protein